MKINDSATIKALTTSELIDLARLWFAKGETWNRETVVMELCKRLEALENGPK